ncbi:Peptidase M50 domain containing protein [Trichuris trichiura]|uniref:Membrane-bound transcription factor site-2 protease n=1 Tax=Trichuris trichiura TaxID=36087 RepID=A0A077Z9D0_TRITR|nr:Peptidase M50 domain containing protein [Trichuris trichiura]
MDLWLFFLFLMTLWGIIYLMDALMRHGRVKSYQRFLEKTELTLGLFYAKLYVFRMNNIIPTHVRRIPNRTRIALSCWFTVGVVATCILGVLAIKFLFLNVVQLFKPISTSLEPSGVTSWNNGEAKNTGGLVAIIPGVNMPWCHVPLLFLALALCATIHELGHAVAALNEDMLVDGFGFIFFVIFPGAFTDLNRNDLNQSSVLKKLKVYCAGVWHNLCLSAVASLLLSSTWPASDKNTGVMIHERNGLSSAAFPYDLVDGEIIYSINGCPCGNMESWFHCLDSIGMEKPGYCFPRHIVHMAINRPVDTGWEPEEHDFCFLFRLPESDDSLRGYFCTSQQVITTAKSCGYNVSCPKTFRCVIPGLLKSSRLFYLTLGRKQNGITYVITSLNNLYAINVTESAAVCNVYSNVDVIEVLLQLTAALSFAFALLNAVPCFGLDGHHLVDAVAKSVMPLATGNGPYYIAVASQVLSFVGTCLVVVSILVALLPYLTTLA